MRYSIAMEVALPVLRHQMRDFIYQIRSDHMKATMSKPPSGTASLHVVNPPQLIRERAFESLRGAIISGEFEPGTRLIERELCEAMGVSRTSIREVLRRLEAERLVLVEPRKGPIVARLTRSQAREIYDIRSYLEGMLLRRFVENASDDAIDALIAITERFEKAVEDDDLSSSVSIMAKFYAHIADIAESEVAADVLSQLTARVSFLRMTSMAQPGRMARSVAEIRSITNAAAARDAKAAEAAAIRHVASAAKTAMSKLED